MRATHFVLLTAVAVMSLGVVGCQTTPAPQGSGAMQAAKRFPFNVQQINSHFEPTAEGGIHRLDAKYGAGGDQIELVRQYLRRQAKRIRRGDLSAFTRIYGEDMPGLATLKTNTDRIRVRYRDTPRGGEIRYATDAADLARAIHTWFEARLFTYGRLAKHDIDQPE